MHVSEIGYRGMTTCVWLENEPDLASDQLPVQRLVVHSFTTCDGCGMSPVVGVRYHPVLSQKQRGSAVPGDEWVSHGSSFHVQDFLANSNRLDKARTASYYLKNAEESFILAVCLPMTQCSNWIQPSAATDGDDSGNSVRIAISQRRDMFVAREDERLPTKSAGELCLV